MISVRDLDKQVFPESESLLVFFLQQIIPCHAVVMEQIAHDPCLAAVVDIASPDRMRSDRLLAPAIQLGNQRAVSLCLRAILVFISRPFVVIMLLEIFAK